MKVLHVYKDYPPVRGGIEHSIEWIAGAQRRRGLDVEVLVTNQERQTTTQAQEGVLVTRAARLFAAASTPVSLALFQEIGRRKPDLIHLHFPYPIGELAWLLRGRSPAVISYYSDIIRQRRLLQLYRPFMHLALRRARRIIVQDLRYAESSPHLGRYLSKCRVAPLGIDPTPFAPTPDLLERAAALKARLGGPLALFVGRFRAYKGVHHLVEAMRLTGGHLALVGDGPERPKLEAAARDPRLAARVHFLGTLSPADLPAAYHACDVFALPSIYRSEAWGLVLLEAMAAGKPVISTELGTGTSILNLHGETGLVTPPADAESLARALDTLFGDPALRRRMGANGQARVRARYSLDSAVYCLLAVYEDALSDAS